MSVLKLSIVSHQMQIWLTIKFPDIVRDHGRKSLYFSNRAAAVHMLGEDDFIRDEDMEEYKTHQSQCFTLNIAVHELIGHGCGKFLEEKDTSANFNLDQLPLNPLTNQPITSWYKPQQTFRSVFGGLSSTISECLAEGISLYLVSSGLVGEILEQPTLSSAQCKAPMHKRVA